MEMRSEVVLVSAFGRGHWLAASLAQESVDTTLIDISHLMGVWPAEDIEGPFGFFKSEKISESQLERLSYDDPYSEVPCGWALWTRQGPLEFKGSTSRYALDSLKMPQQIKEVFLSSQASKKVYQDLDSFSFSESWLLHLSHQWCSARFMPNESGAYQGQATVLTSSFLTRQATRNGHDKSLQWLKSRGVKVIKPQKLEDISTDGRMISGIELQGDLKGVYRFEQLVWCLSSEETYFVNQKLGQKFFASGARESEWSWVRYRVGIDKCVERENLPSYFAMIPELDLTWSHQNYMILMRTTSESQFDCWMRIPTVQRFNKEYLTEKGQRLITVLSEFIGRDFVQVLSYPQEYSYTYAQLGPSRFPVYKNNLKDLKVKYKNMYLAGNEVLPRYQWEQIFALQEGIRTQIMNWWTKKKIAEQKKKKELEA